METLTPREMRYVSETSFHPLIRRQRDFSQKNLKYTRIAVKPNENFMKWRGCGLSRNSLSFDEIFDLKGDKLCPRNLFTFGDNNIDRNFAMKIEITRELPWNPMAWWRGVSSSPKSPPVDENFDLEGDKLCSRELFSSTDTIPIQIMRYK